MTDELDRELAVLENWSHRAASKSDRAAFRRARDRIARLQGELGEAQKELCFYRTLTVSRHEDVTAIDGGETAEKLDVLWEKARRTELAENRAMAAEQRADRAEGERDAMREVVEEEENNE